MLVLSITWLTYLPVRQRVRQLLQLLFISLTIQMHNAQAQERGDITVHLVNDSDSVVDIVWMNHLMVTALGEFVPMLTGPLLPRSMQSYKSNVGNRVELHQVEKECSNDDDNHLNDNTPQQCLRASFRVVSPTDPAVKANVFILSPDFSPTITTNKHVLEALLAQKAIDATIRIRNQYPRPIYFYWVNPGDRSLVAMSEGPMGPITSVTAGEEPTYQYFSASVFHEFQIHDAAAASVQKTNAGDDECASEAASICQKRSFRVIDRSIDVTVLSNFALLVEPTPAAAPSPQQPQDDMSRESSLFDLLSNFKYQAGEDLYQQCRDYVLSIATINSPIYDPHHNAPVETIIGAIEKCIKDHFHTVDWGYEANLQAYSDSKLEDYICNEPRMETTPEQETRQWTSTSGKDPITRSIVVLHETASSNIHLLPHFVSTEECLAMEQVAEPFFQPTKTSDGKGGYRLNRVRKASIAPVDIPFDEAADANNNNHPIARIRRRIFDYANHVLPQLKLADAGQEPLVAIHYHGRGREDPHPDQYKAHLDGDSLGQPLRAGLRVATMVLYCAVPEEGGHTNFRHVHVHIKPQPGSAVFFSYVNPNEQLMDKSTTIHAGCPVYRGVKKIVTQWIRYGVTAEQPHSNFPL